jgi:hypothetical protein
MKRTLAVLGLTLLSCSSVKYTSKTFFDTKPHDYQMNTDVKTLIYLCLDRAVVKERDIPDYSLISDKAHIYIQDLYYTKNGGFITAEEFNASAVVLDDHDIPNQISGISFCLKSTSELQDIANQSQQDFMFLNFSLISIENNRAIVQLNNNWMVQQNSEGRYLSGGGYTCLFKKVNGQWVFDKVTKMIIS